MPGQRPHAVPIGHVERKKPDFKPLVPQCSGSRLPLGMVTRGKQHTVAAPSQLAAGFETQPATGAADDS